MVEAQGHALRILRAADVPDNRTGGMSRTMYCTGDELQRTGHKIDYIFHETFKWSIPRQLWRYLRTWEVLFQIMRRMKAGEYWDVIEMHEPLGMAYGLARYVNRALPPLVIFSYGVEQRSYTAMRNYRRAKSIPFAAKSIVTCRALVAQANLAIRRAQHVICSNQEDVDFIAAQKGVPSARLTRHHSGVEQQFLDAGNQEADLARQGLLFVGSWIERKGILDMVPAVNRVLAADPSATFTVAGCNCPPETVLTSFQEAVRPRIRVIPRISSTDELIRVYRTHAILALPSYFEGQPLVMIEAAALGLAIVTTPICGMLDFIDDGVNGIFTPVGDAEALFEALMALVLDPEQTARLGANARQSAASHTWHAAAMKIELAYHAALQSNAHTGD